MKTLRIIFLVLLVIVALLGFGLQTFLNKGLTAALNQTVFPAVQSMYGLELSIENASVNLLKGSAELQGFAVRNLKGYEEPTLLTFDQCRLDIEMMSLLKRDPIIIKLAEAKGATLTIERNKEKKYNVKELADALKPVESAKDPSKPKPESEPAPAKEKAKSIPVHIRRIAMDATVIYADSKRDRKFPLNLRLTGSDLFTVPAEGQSDSLLVLRGSLADDENAFTTDLNAIVEPLVNPAKPSFNATGSVLDIDAEFLKELLDKNDMESGSFSIKPSITCEKGRLKGSYIDLILTDLKIYGAEIGDTTLPMQLGGTLKKPTVDLTAALQALFSEQSVNILKTIGLKELGISSTDTPSDMIAGGLTNSVKEIAESPELQQLIQQVLDPDATSTNPPLSKTLSDVLFEQLEKNVKEVETNDADDLKGMINSLFGD